ncbi:MAG: hypothetical protein IJ371_05775 [Clostridia bacterium]|nr:hypothetical protein [Clostridia bacterium]
MKEQQWYEDIMLQKFSNFQYVDITKIIIAIYLAEHPNCNKNWKSKEVLNFVYDFYADNDDVAKLNPSSIIRNIKKYGVDDIRPLYDDALFEWVSDAKNGVLKYNSESIFLNLDEMTTMICQRTMQIAGMLFKKYIKKDLKYNHSIDEVRILDDKDINDFGISRYRNRLLREVQYCSLCEDIQIDNLCAVHISDSGADEDAYIDENNGLILCKEHATDFVNKCFYFDDRGYVVNRTSSAVNNKMHLSQRLLNKKRKEYLKTSFDINRNN